MYDQFKLSMSSKIDKIDNVISIIDSISILIQNHLSALLVLIMIKSM